MLLYVAVAVLAGFVAHRFWVLSRFMRGGEKSVQIFILTFVTGICLISNVILPFLLTGACIVAVEVHELLQQTQA